MRRGEMKATEKRCILKKTIELKELDELVAVFYRNSLEKRKNSVLLLEGNLGAGKTTFCSSLGKALRVRETVQSPTFNLLNIYHGEDIQFYHYDLYRIRHPEEVRELGFSDYWSQESERQIHAVEWWERAPDSFVGVKNLFLIKLTYDLDDETDSRNIEIYEWKNENET